jgi:glycosyltransferase involved in cell wall biosynthesis
LVSGPRRGHQVAPLTQSVVRVLHVVARLGLGGSERIAQVIAEELGDRGFKSGILPVAGDNDTLLAANIRARLRAHGVDILTGSTQQSAKVAIAEAAVRIPSGVHVFRPDVVHLHTEIPEFAWAVATLAGPSLMRLPLIRTVHSSVLWGGWGRLGGLGERRLDRARVVAVSSSAAEGFARWRRSIGRPVPCIQVIYNGIRDEPPASAPAAPSTSGSVRICFAGRFAHEKGVDLLLDALEQLDGADLEFGVVILGTGPGAREIRARATRLRRSVEIRPPTAELRRRLHEFDAIVMPSRFEGLPLLAVETIWAGVPLLAADAPGLREAVPPDYPGRFAANDSAALAASIAAFARDPGPWRRAAAGAREWARERFSMTAMLDAYEEVYRQAAVAHGRPPNS